MNTNENTAARTWSLIAGSVLVLVGLLGFVPNPIVGGRDALATTDGAHNMVHIVTGLIALAIYFMVPRASRAGALIGFGVLYAVIFLAVLASPDLFGLFAVPANATLHVIHLTLAVVSLWLGYSARGGAAEDARGLRTA
jgi:uncharacterized membrane protein